MADVDRERCDNLTLITCEGDLSDPGFPTHLKLVLDGLDGLLGDKVKVHKLEPWNSVRVTLSIPREAALRLRQLANEGSHQLRALGILSVQVEGDQVISLRLASGSVSNEPQEIILRTSQDESTTSERRDPDMGIPSFLSPATAVPSAPSNTSTANNNNNNNNNNSQVQFKSPNVVCPSDSVVPKVSANVPSSSSSSSSSSNGSSGKTFGPFPFTSMNQAIHSSSSSSRETTTTSFGSLPPPYPGKQHPPVTISSPLLVNLLQNDGTKEVKVRPVRTPPGGLIKPPQVEAVANSLSPSALSANNVSIRQSNSTLMTSTSNGMGLKTPSATTAALPPPQYHRAVVANKLSTSSVVTASNPFTNSHSQNPLSSLHPPPSSPLVPPPPPPPPQQAASIPPQGAYQQQKNFTVAPLSSSNLPLAQGNSMLKQKASAAILNQTRTPLLPPNLALAKTAALQKNSLVNNVLNNVNRNMTAPKNIYSNQKGLVGQPSTPDANPTSLNNVMLRSMPSPPPYSVAISRPWDTLTNSSALLQDLTPSLADLKPDDLDDLLPTLERELTQSPLPDLTGDFLNVVPPPQPPDEDESDKRKFLVNPLTGELEPRPPSDESDVEEQQQDVFTGLPSPAAISDEEASAGAASAGGPKQDGGVAPPEHSDGEARAATVEGTKQRLKNAVRERGRDSPALKQEKIKLRLKLEKSEPINPAYKVDVSFINSQPKKASTSMMSPASEELRVPPLHISLRGRNSAVIKNKTKLNPDGVPVKPKIRKNPDHIKLKKGLDEGNEAMVSEAILLEQMKSKMNSLEQKKAKKLKVAHEHKELLSSLAQESELKSKFILHNHYKEKQKERRGSDSELVRNNKKYLESSMDEKKRRYSQTEQTDDGQNVQQPIVPGSTNIGTIAGLKPRKDKPKMRDLTGFKKDSSKSKAFGKAKPMIALPTAGDMNMEAKFKQGLLEADKGVHRPPHRTEIVNCLVTESNRVENSTEKVVKTVPDTTSLKDKSPEPDKCNTPDIKSSAEIGEKPSAVVVGGGRSPNSAGGQGEDSGIESMDALSEKSPNQASQSPHADILPPKTQVPNMLDIEAQLAKMEGLNGDTDAGGGGDGCPDATNIPTEDVNDNKCRIDTTSSSKIKQCCEIACALQDGLKQGGMSPKQQNEIEFLPSKVKKEEEDLEPLPVRVTPALYTYSNPDKSRSGFDSPTALSDDDSNSCSTSSTLPSKPSKSLLEQLLIEIPNDHQGVPSSPSPATRSSMRTRALSKLGSPELSSPVPKSGRTVGPPPAKRKRNESDSSSHSFEEMKKKPKKTSTSITTTVTSDQPPPGKANNNNTAKKAGCGTGSKQQQQDESSDSDEPLIEKLRKPIGAMNSNNSVMTAKAKMKGAPAAVANNNKLAVNTRRSVRSNMPAQNTRSKGDRPVTADSDALRRKTRSAVMDVESKRKKEVK